MTEDLHDLPFDIVELVPCAPTAEYLATAPLREIAFRKDVWTPEELDRVYRLFREDRPIDEIAAELDRTFEATRAKVYQLGWRRNSVRPWNELEDEFLVWNYGSAPASEIAAAMGRSPSSIYNRARKHNLTQGNPPAWSPWEDAQLCAGYAQGTAVAQLAQLIGRSASGVLSRAYTLDLRHANHPPDWTREEGIECLRLAETGMVYSKIGDTLAKLGFPRRSYHAIFLFLSNAGYRRGWGRPWTAEEEDSLRAAYARSDSIRQWAFQHARTICSVRWKAGELGLQGTHAKTRGFCGEAWSQEDIALLKAEYGKTKTAELAGKLNRSHGAVTQRAHSLGLENGFSRPFTEAEDRAFHIAWASQDITFRDLAEAMDRDLAVIFRHSRRLGLKFSERPHQPPRTRRRNRRRWTLQEILALDALPVTEAPIATSTAPPADAEISVDELVRIVGRRHEVVRLHADPPRFLVNGTRSVDLPGLAAMARRNRAPVHGSDFVRAVQKLEG